MTDVEARNVSNSGEACPAGYCVAIRHEVSGYVKEPGKNAVLYRAWCNDIIWVAGKAKGQHSECIHVVAGESYRAWIFPLAIDFGLGKHPTQSYQIASQHEASEK